MEEKKKQLQFPARYDAYGAAQRATWITLYE